MGYNHITNVKSLNKLYAPALKSIYLGIFAII